MPNAGAIFVRGEGPDREERFVYQEDFAKARAEGWRPRPGDRILLQRRTGTVAVPAEELFETLQEYPEANVASATEAQEAYGRRIKEQTYGGLSGQVAAGGLGLLRGGSLGLSDVALQSLGVDRETLEGYREVHPHTSLGTELAGAIGPAFVTGGGGAALTGGRLARTLARTPAGYAIRAGESIAAHGAGKGLGARLAARTAGAGVEGAAIGAGEGISRLALSEDPVDAEKALATLGTGALFGAGVGGAAGFSATVLSKAAGKGLQRAKRYLDDFKTRASSPETPAPVVADIVEYHTRRGDSDVWLLAKGEPKKVLVNQSRTMRRSLDAPVTLGERPRGLLTPLEREEKVLRELMEEPPDDLLSRLSQHDHKVASQIREKLASSKPATEKIRLERRLATEWRDIKGLKGKGPLKIKVSSAENFIDALESGELQARRAAAIRELPELLAQNRALAAEIRRVTAPQKEGFVEGAAKQAAGVYGMGALIGMLPGGPIGAAGALLGPRLFRSVSNLVFGRLGKATGEASQRISKALDNLATAGKKAEKAAPVSATKVLEQAVFAPPAERTALEKAAAPAASKLHEAFRQREKELHSQTKMGPGGTIQPTPQARDRIADALAPVRAGNPLLADRMETTAARKLAFLAAKLPRRPDTMARSIGPDLWRPPNMEMRRFARYVQATEDPTGVVERLGDGSLLPQDVEALREVYPELYEEIRGDVLGKLAQRTTALPWNQRLALSIFLDAPLDPMLDPRVIATLQGHFAAEPGTEGGTMPPVPKPQFGSLSKQEPSPGQERAAG